MSRAALFLCRTLFLTALSAKEIAFLIFVSFLVFLAKRTEASREVIIVLFTDCFLRLPLRARLAVFVTGIKFLFSDCEYNLKKLEYQGKGT